MTDDAKELSQDESMQSGGLAFLLTLITCGIYSFYWAYKMGKAIEKAQSRNGLAPKDNSIPYLILQLLGFGIINYCLMQNDLNEIAKSLNNGQAQQA